jgi:hypothetical protein
MIRMKQKFGLPVIDLDGAEGYGWYLCSHAENFGKQLDYSPEVRTEIVEKMKSGSYANLVKTFDDYFGDYVILETNDPELFRKLS